MTPRSAWAAGGNPPDGEEDAIDEREPIAPEVVREFLMAHLSAMDGRFMDAENRRHREQAMAYGRALGRYLRGERGAAA